MLNIDVNLTVSLEITFVRNNKFSRKIHQHNRILLQVIRKLNITETDVYLMRHGANLTMGTHTNRDKHKQELD